MNTKKIILSLLLFIGISWAVFAQNESTHDTNTGIAFFEGTWEEALIKSKSENKPIFLDVYASWCQPCKLLKKNTFPDADVGDFFNQHYINVSLDGEKGDGIAVAKQLQVSAYPSLFILNASGDPVVYYAGYLKAETFLEFGQAGIKQLEIQ